MGIPVFSEKAVQWKKITSLRQRWHISNHPQQALLSKQENRSHTTLVRIKNWELVSVWDSYSWQGNWAFILQHKREESTDFMLLQSVKHWHSLMWLLVEGVNFVKGTALTTQPSLHGTHHLTSCWHASFLTCIKGHLGKRFGGELSFNMWTYFWK